MNERQKEVVLYVAKDSIHLTEYISKMKIHGKYDSEMALHTLNRLIIEARYIMRGTGPTARANTEYQYLKLGI